MVVAAAVVAGLEDYSAGLAASVAAAACPQHCFVVQLSDSVACLKHLPVDSLAVVAAVGAILSAVTLMLVVGEQKPVETVAAA